MAPRNLDYACKTLSLSSTYDCKTSSASYSVITRTCSNVDVNYRFSSYVSSSPVTLTSIASYSLTLTQGYNMFTDSSLTKNLELLPGDLIMITGLGGAAIAVDTSGTAPQSDYLLNAGYLSPLDSTKNMRFFVRTIVSPFAKVIISILHNLIHFILLNPYKLSRICLFTY